MVWKICAQPIPSIVSACDSGRLTVFLSFSGPTGIPSAYDIPSPWRNVFQDEPRSKGDRVSPKLHFLGSVDVRMKGLVAGQRLQRDSFCLGWKQCILMSFPGWWVWLPWAIPPIHGHFDGTMMLNQWLEWAFPIVQSDKAITIMENLRRPFHLHFPVSKKKKLPENTSSLASSHVWSSWKPPADLALRNPSRPPSLPLPAVRTLWEPARPSVRPPGKACSHPTSLWWGCSCGYSHGWDDCWPKMNEKKLEKNKNPSIIHHPNIPLCHTMPSFFDEIIPSFWFLSPKISTSWDFQQRHRPRRSGPKVVTSWDWRCPRNAGAPSWRKMMAGEVLKVSVTRFQTRSAEIRFRFDLDLDWIRLDADLSEIRLYRYANRYTAYTAYSMKIRESSSNFYLSTVDLQHSKRQTKKCAIHHSPCSKAPFRTVLSVFFTSGVLKYSMSSRGGNSSVFMYLSSWGKLGSRSPKNGWPTKL